MIAALILAANVAVAQPIAPWTDAPGRKRVEYLAPGAILRGYSYVGKVARGPVLLVFGGQNQATKTLDEAARGFTRQASRVVVYDYRGYGLSTGGVATDNDLRADAVRLYDATLAGSSVKRVAVLGVSTTGAVIGAYVATQRKVAGLILIPDIPEFYKPSWLREIRAPLLVFQDEHLEKIAASPDKRFVAVDATHKGVLGNQQSQAAVAEFLEHVANL